MFDNNAKLFCGRIKRLFFSVGKNRRVLKNPLPLFHAARPLPRHKRKADTKNAMAHLP